MMDGRGNLGEGGAGRGVRWRVGCVSFLNSKPLIEALVGRADVEVRFGVPAGLLELVERREVDAGLLPIVDYQGSREELVLVPAGAIGSDGRTYTVRIFSKVPAERITCLYGDSDSHTSVILAQVVLRERFGGSVEMRDAACEMRKTGGCEAMLLIGDKVVNAAPSLEEYPYQLDLGEEWKRLTGLPFVFACWMMRADDVDRELVGLLDWGRRVGAGMTEELVRKYARGLGWPEDLARRYFTEYLQYEVTERSRAGIEKFFELADRHGLLARRRAVRYVEC